MTHQLPGWAEKLKGQTIVEDTMGGKPERSAMVEQQHQRIMEQWPMIRRCRRQQRVCTTPIP